MPIKYLDSYLTIITKNNNSQSHNGVIIMAHGEKTNKTFDLGKSVAHYYCPDGSSLVANCYGLMTDLVKQGKNYDLETGKNSNDYFLYKGVGRGMHKNVSNEDIEDYITFFPKLAQARNVSNYKYLDQLVSDGRIQYDIVSIRNTFLVSEYGFKVRFSYVVNTLKKKGYGYGNIHCCFCRSTTDKKHKNYGTYYNASLEKFLTIKEIKDMNDEAEKSLN